MRKFLEELFGTKPADQSRQEDLRASCSDGPTLRSETDKTSVKQVAFASGRYPTRKDANPFWQIGADGPDIGSCSNASLSSGHPVEIRSSARPQLIRSEGLNKA